MTGLLAEKLSKVDPNTLDITKWAKFMPPGSDRSSDEFCLLKESLETHGQKEPVEIYQDGVIDGVQRVLALRDIGERCLVTFIPDDRFESETAVEAYMLGVQLSRRNLRDAGWKRCLARLFKLKRGTGVSKADFARQKAEELGATPKHIQRAIDQGEDLERVATDVLTKVTKMCDRPDQVVPKLARLSPEEQRRVVANNDTQRTIRAAADASIRKQAEEKVHAPPQPTPEVSKQPPMTAHIALISRITEALDRAAKLLQSLLQEDPLPSKWAESAELAEAARETFARAVAEDNP